MPKGRVLISTLITVIQFSIIAIVIFKDNAKNIFIYSFGINADQYIDWMGENKIKSGIVGYFAGNLLKGFISNVGAFEIYCNDDLLWSAVNNQGRVPQIDAISILIEQYGYKLLK